tara:strand:- start:468 stop:1475 length:1008 start_codon:yes stop_codon:yes gene_type:complete
MAFQKVEFEFPEDEQEDAAIEVEDSGEVEIDLSGKKTAEDYKEPEPEVEPEVEDKVEVEVYDDTPKADRNRKPSEPPSDVTDDELADYSEKVQQRIKHFSKGYHDERRAKESAQREREELEQYAQRLIDENKELKGTVNKNQEALLEQAKRATESELEAAKQTYKEAYESGEADRVVEAQEALTNVKIRSDRLDNFALPPLQEEETPVQQSRVADPRAEKWANDNPWFKENQDMRDVAMAIHQSLMRNDITPQEDTYYEQIDVRMRSFYPDYFNEGGAEEVEKPKPRSNVVAPAARSTSPKKVRLSQSAQAIARKLGVPLEEYAKQMAALNKTEG